MTNLSLYLLNDLLIFVESFTLYQLGNCFFPYRGKRKMLPLYLVLMTLTTIVGVLLANGHKNSAYRAPAPGEELHGSGQAG